MRRLSNGSNFLGAFVDEEDSDMDMMSVSEAPLSRRTSTNSRRSSFRSASGDGKSGHQTAMEQARISDMYKVVIKLSAENVSVYIFVLTNHYDK